MGYAVIEQTEVDRTTVEEYYSRNLETVSDPNTKDEFRQVALSPIDDALQTERVHVKLWYFEPGDEMIYHAHSSQEEVYYILDGELSVKLGDPTDPEIVEVGPGTFYAAGPETGHGHRCIGDVPGVVLAIGAPPGFDPGRDPADFMPNE